MEYTMSLKLLNPLVKAVGMIAVVVLVNACSSDNNPATATTNNATKTVTQIPWEALTVPDLNGLSAQVIIDGNTGAPVNMTIDTTAHTASVSTSLSKAPHTVQIIYRYTDISGTITIAQSSIQNVDLTGGSTTIDIPNTAYDTTSFDADTDGLSNAYELAAGQNPNDASCAVGYGLLGSCTL
jgi:hypothetical protein